MAVAFPVPVGGAAAPAAIDTILSMRRSTLILALVCVATLAGRLRPEGLDTPTRAASTPPRPHVHGNNERPVSYEHRPPCARRCTRWEAGPAARSPSRMEGRDMRHHIRLLLIASSPPPRDEGPAPPPPRAHRPGAPPSADTIRNSEYRIAMRDGNTAVTSSTCPRTFSRTEDLSILMERTGYSVAPYA